MDPLFPMEPKSATNIPASSKWIAQIKWDGVHILTYSDGQTTRLLNRKKESVQRTIQNWLLYKHTVRPNLSS